MVAIIETSTLPRTLAEFSIWEPEDGFKYEWNDGELIKFIGMNKTQFYIFGVLNRLFISKGYWTKGTFVAEHDVQLSGIQMRRPDICYFSLAQENLMKQGQDVIPDFVIEVISGNDKASKVEEKTIEYFKAGIKVLWLIYPDNKTVHVYTSTKQAQICSDDDVCSAKPVLEDFEISVNNIFA